MGNGRQNIQWYLARLGRMSIAEIGYRICIKVLFYINKLGIGTADKVPVPDIAIPSKQWIAAAIPTNHDAYVKRAESILNGNLAIFSLPGNSIDYPPNWNKDPKTGTQAPLVYGKSINYRNPHLVGDIKYLWEPNRHLHLVALAQAYYITGDSQYLEGIKLQLTSWFQQCPYPMGPNWVSSLELGIRLINWSIVWQLVGEYDSPLFEGEAGCRLREQWLRSIYQHCHFINGYWSRYSSANNHLIGEAAGLLIASITWPYWKYSNNWREHAYKILLEESLKQNCKDGVNREQAISYQQFVLDFLLMAGLAARAEGRDFPPEYWKIIERMLEFIAAVMDVNGNVPMIGDADDGYVISFAANNNFCPYRSLLSTGSFLFNRPDFLLIAGEVDDKTSWLLGETSKKLEVDQKRITIPVKKAFPDGGYYIIGSKFNEPDEIRCTVDCGPLGYLSIAAHGHADALSFTLSVGGREILVDPGTYAYHTKKEWRDYFRGTSAHNTVRVDGLDQSESGGNFMWLRKAKTICEEWVDETGVQRIRARHNGYERLIDPVSHEREIRFEAGSQRIIVEDLIECADTHSIERAWHFSEDCEVVIDGTQLRVRNQEKDIQISLAQDCMGQIDMYQGSEHPIYGWISRHFDHKLPTITVVERMDISGPTRLVAKIECGLKRGE